MQPETSPPSQARHPSKRKEVGRSDRYPKDVRRQHKGLGVQNSEQDNGLEGFPESFFPESAFLQRIAHENIGTFNVFA